MLAARLLVLVVGCATALRLPTAPAKQQASVGSIGRRDLLSVAASAAVFALPLAAPAYDALPSVDADFAQIEKLRMEREAAARAKFKEVNTYVVAIEGAKDKDTFIQAADKFAVWVIGEGKFPEGLKIKEMVKRISVAYDALPKVQYRCTPTRTNQGVCFTPGRDAEAAYESLLKEIRQYSLIVVGDYRTVTYKAF